MAGWGLGGWGLGGWGLGGGGAFQLLNAEPFRENVVRLFFSDAVYFSGLLDPSDASSRKRYVVQPVQGSVDDDGDPTRPVFPATIAIAAFAGAAGRALDVTLDRPLSSWPSRYSIAVNHLRSSGGVFLDPNATSARFDGLQYDELGGANRPVVSSGDFANPQTANGLALGISPEQAAILGSYPIGPSGDYSTDQGLASYRKRIIRRLLARKGGFAALPSTYGLGPQERIKKLFRGTDASDLSADAEAQVRADPETASCSVSFTSTKGSPQIGYFTVNATHVSGQAISENVPFTLGA